MGGRWAVGGRIVRVDGGAAGFRHAFIRAFIGVLEIWLTAGAVAAIVGAFTPRTQRLGDLVAGQRAAARVGARVALCHVHPYVAEPLRIMNVDDLFDVFESEQDALQSFA